MRDSLAAEKAKADAAIKAPFAEVPAKSSPVLWSNMRDLVFGILDGSNLDKVGFKTSTNGWPIFYQVSKVFSDPAKTLDLDLTGDDKVDLQINWSRAVDAKTLAQKLLVENETLKIGLTEPAKTLEEEKAKLAELLATKSRLQDLLESRTESANVPEKTKQSAGKGVETVA
jgi:hypothetical protein